MDINATIIGQFITFSILVWFTMKYIWPPITKTLHDREKKIADGLYAAEQSKRELELAEHKASRLIRDAKDQATQIIAQANSQAASLIDEAKVRAKQAGEKMLAAAQEEMNLEVIKIKTDLKNQLATLAIAGAEKIIQQSLNPTIHQQLLDQLAAEI